MKWSFGIGVMCTLDIFSFLKEGKAIGLQRKSRKMETACFLMASTSFPQETMHNKTLWTEKSKFVKFSEDFTKLVKILRFPSKLEIECEILKLVASLSFPPHYRYISIGVSHLVQRHNLFTYLTT